MVATTSEFEMVDINGSTIVFSQNFTTSGTFIPTVADKFISEVFLKYPFVGGFTSDELQISFDEGITWYPLKQTERIVWNPKEIKRVKIKSSAGTIFGKGIINFESF